MTAPASAPGRPPTLVRGLSLLDSVLLMAGGIIGSAIFLAVSDVAAPLASPTLFIFVWILGGAITLLACFAFAELAAMFPNSGGQYVYLREAYGEFYAFLFGWMVLFINFSGTVAALSVGFATYFDEVVPFGAGGELFRLGPLAPTRGQLVALAAIAVMTWVNVVGLRRAATLQNIATWMKFAAIAIFVVFGFALGKGSTAHFSTPAPPAHPLPLVFAIGLALNGVFWAYDGWNYIVCAAGEVKDPQRNIPRALVLGVVAVGVVYISLNVVYLYALPLAAIQPARTVAQSAAIALFSPAVGRWMSLLIAVSCFGAASCCTLAGARVVYAMACDRAFLPKLAYVHPRYRTPSLALIVLGAWSAIAGAQRSLRRALHLRDVRGRDRLRGHRGRSVRAAPQASGDAASVSLHRLSLGAGVVSDRHDVGGDRGVRTPERGGRRSGDHAHRGAGVSVLEAALDSNADHWRYFRIFRTWYPAWSVGSFLTCLSETLRTTLPP